MEVWRIMIGIVNLDDNTEDTSDLRHAGSFPTVSDLTGIGVRGKSGEFFQIPAPLRKVQ